MSQVTNVKFTVNIEGGHDALVSDPHVEVCRILDTVKQKIRAGYVGGLTRDLNGNKIGAWHLDIELEEE